MTPKKKTITRRRAPTKTARPRTKKLSPPPREEPPAPELVAAPEPETGASGTEVPLAEFEIPLSSPEPLFAARVPPPEPERPFPHRRRAIFFDVENTSRAQHIARVIDHLAIDRLGHRTEFVAVGNWRVIGHDTARLLAAHGAHLVHSAPSVGVRDWSDLRIAVAAGAWLAAARPGDVIEIVSDDRAFDAVGDVAASLGIPFRRLSYRGLTGAPVEAAPRRVPEHRVSESRAPARDAGSHRYRGRRRGRGQGGPARPVPPPVSLVAGDRGPGAVVHAAPPAGEAHTAPHDEIVAVVRDLMSGSPNRTITIDTLANALKERGFSRTSGSPRLITRLRRIKEIEVSRAGMITLVGSVAVENGAEEPEAVERKDVEAVERKDLEAVERVDEDLEAGGDGPEPGNEALVVRQPADDPLGQLRRRRRGGRRGGRGRRRPAAHPAQPAQP
jgi:hypothetical protein